MTTNHRFERTLSDLLVDLGTVDPTDLVVDVVDATARLSQRPAWRQAGWWLTIGRGLPGAGPSMTGTQSMSVILALLLLALLAALASRVAAPPPPILRPPDAIRSYTGRISPAGPVGEAEGISGPIALPDGRVLAFGKSGPMVWSGDAGPFASIAGQHVMRYAPLSVVLADGRVLVIGGDSTPIDAQGASTVAWRIAEIWDPRTGASSPPIPLVTPRWITAAIRLPDGRVLVSGGLTTDGPEEALATAELFDPATETFALTGSMNSPRLGHSMALLPDGRVVVAGGDVGLDDEQDTPVTEIYDPTNGTFAVGDPLTPIGPNPDDSRYPLSARSPVVTLAGGEVLVPGLRCQEVHDYRPDGLSDGVRETPIERFEPATDAFSIHGAMPHCVHMAIPLPNGELYVRGWWYESSGVARPWAGLYDPATEAVRQVEAPTVNAQPYIDAVALADGRVAFFGSDIQVMR